MQIHFSPLYEFKPTAAENKLTDDVAAVFLKRHKITNIREQYAGHQVEETKAKVPSLVITDFSEIPFLDNLLGVQFYQYRLRILADSEDILGGTFPIDPHFEKYDQQYLNIGHPEYIELPHRKYKTFLLPKDLTVHKDAFERLVEAVKRKNIQYIHPYMGVRDVWTLCLDLSKAVGRKLKVFAPLPYICKWANDKSYLAHFIRQLFGHEDVIRTKWANHLDGICEALKELAPQYNMVALKIADYASAFGNILYQSKDLIGLSDDALKKRVKKDLENHDWKEGATVCIVHWRDDVLSSPSTQMWIPALNEGPPFVEGVFEQILQGEKKVFQGSRPSELPKKINDITAKKSFLMGLLFQKLGYVGRCSFDFIVSGKDLSSAEVQFVECNGRWGGTSLPMSFVNRMFDNFRSISYKALDIVHPKLKGVEFKKFLSIFKKGELYNAKTKKGYYLFYNTACLKPTAKFDVIAIGDSQEHVLKRVDEELIELIERSF